MRYSTWIFSALIIGVIGFAGCTESDPDKKVTVISGATLFDGTGAEAIRNSMVVIRGGEIDCVGKDGECSVPLGAEVINAEGKFITPGLVDAHMHFFQTGFFDSRPDAMDITDVYPFAEVAAYQKQNPQRYYNSYLCSGITAVYDVGGMSWSIDFQEEAENNPKAPHVAAAGPLITPVPGAPFDLPSGKVLVTLDSEETGVKTVQYLSALGSTGIKFWTFDEDSDEYMQRVEATADEIRRQGNQMISHATTLDQAKAALRNGTRLLVHSVQNTEVDDEFIKLAKENGTYYNPTLIVSAGYMLAFRAAADIAPIPVTDPNGCVDSKTMDLITSASQFQDHSRLSGNMKNRLQSFNSETDMTREMLLTNLKKVYEAGIPIVVGTDAGNPGTLHGVSIFDEMEYMQQAGIPAKELIVMATKNGAESMRRGDDFGTLVSGKLANLILLEENPAEDISNMRSLTHVMIKGKLMDVGEIQTE
ncbi:MAG: amidohydrolase family protein [Gracilimonas sp.]|uniref:amidohydrolase family protein n=1 Tax=Gracilimonas sp. TaxID=1974203 RepID=UPI001B2E61E0|nr:amidohydrolase family protein [Gracilimonas sp.]MBO6585210.1 amidohydrolase family protein [Gracilimonas sp.]MBO6615518.1 amidohydrolase family protein [Gracilimonas sp.]